MGSKPKAKPRRESDVRALLERHRCAIPFHEVRTRFLGNIATPGLAASPLQMVKDLWGGELPTFESMDEVNELLDVLVNGLWNDLTRHQKRDQPFKLTRIPHESSVSNLERIGRVRQQELDGFLNGLFDGQERLDLPQRACEAVDRLCEFRAIMAGICDFAAQDPGSKDVTNLASTFKLLRELNRVMETEINETVLSCTRARQQIIAGMSSEWQTVH